MSAIAEQPTDAGILPVPLDRRRLGFPETFVLWADLGVSFLVMVVGMFLVPGLGLGQAFVAILVGALIGNFLLAVGAVIGSDTGAPTMVLMRPSLGIRGSYLPSALNVVQLIGWATLEVIVMAQAADALLTRLVGIQGTYALWALAFAVLTTVLAVMGPVRVVKEVLERYLIWLVLATTVWLTVAVFLTYNVPALLAQPGTGDLTFSGAVDLVVALPASWFPLVADYSRFSRDRTSAFWGTGLGYAVPHVWFYALGALLALGGGVAVDPEAPIAPLLAAIASLTVGWAALIILLVDEIDEGFADVYSAAVSVQNIAPRLSQRTLCLVFGALVLVLSQVVPLAQYESFLLLIGSVFVPLFGVLAADYFVVRRGAYSAVELYESVAAVRWLGIACWLLGVVVYLAIGGVPAFALNGLAPSLGATLPSLAVSFLLYAALGRFTRRVAVSA